MSQDVNLQLNGLYTAPSDFEGSPDGSLGVADNTEIRYANLGEARRGFETLTPSEIAFKRLINFFVGGSDTIVALTENGDLVYDNNTDPWPALTGDVTDIFPPDEFLAKSRFIKGDQNLYVTSSGGVKSLASGSGSKVLKAGVPRGLDAGAFPIATPGGFLDYNPVVETTGSIGYIDLDSGFAGTVRNLNTIYGITSTTGIAVGQYIGGGATFASRELQQIRYTAVTAGTAGNAISIAYTTGGTAGAEVVTVVGSAISVQIQSGVSTASQIITAIQASGAASALVDVELISTSAVQTAPVPSLPKNFLPGAVIIGADRVSIPGHGFNQGDVVQLTSTGTLPGGLSLLTNYYIIRFDANSIQFAASYYDLIVGVPVDLTSTGAGTQTITPVTFFLENGLALSIPYGTTVETINNPVQISIQLGDTVLGVAQITNIPSVSGFPNATGIFSTPLALVSGPGIPDGTYVTGYSGVPAGPFTLTLSNPVTLTSSNVAFTFSTVITIVMSQAASDYAPSAPISFYTGAQVAYQWVFGRVETQVDGTTITRLGAPSAGATCNNFYPFSIDTTVFATIPKNSDQLTFVQLYRSLQTTSVEESPLSQYSLVYERDLTANEINGTDRSILITDSLSDLLVGAALYSGSDQEGAQQANDPPPMCWDMCVFNDFALYFNTTQPTTLTFTILAVGAPNGVQVNDTITIAGEYLGVPFSEVFTGKASPNEQNNEFLITTAGTSAQNITDVSSSLLRAINYNIDLPVHAIYLSTSTGVPGQILFEADNPSVEPFTVTASAHTGAYDPALTGIDSDINTVSNRVGASKIQKLEAVPVFNSNFVGDASSPILRGIALRNYVIVLKSDGVYKITGSTPNTLSVTTFDLTTKVIGPDTAVALDSAVWMLSTQGVVKISDGGIELKSIPIDNQLNALKGAILTNLVQNSFAMAYEDDQKYILCVPVSENDFAEREYNFNYITNAWTTWSRNFYYGFVSQLQSVIYVARADSDNVSVSIERKNYSYRDYSDESLTKTIISVDGDVVTLNNVTGVKAGDIFYQTTLLFCYVLSVDSDASTVTLQAEMEFTPGSVTIYTSYLCRISWKEVYGENPTILRQFIEGQILFKNTRFSAAYLTFITDFSNSDAALDLGAYGLVFWGLFGWGTQPWGGVAYPKSLRFLIPQEKQQGSYIQPSFLIQQAWSDWKLQGLSIDYENLSVEVGK